MLKGNVGAKGDDLKKIYSDLGKTIPLGREGEAEEYADLVAFLCSARASYLLEQQ